MNKIVLSLLVILSLTACDNNQEQSPQNEKPTIKIGVTLPLSGEAANVGEANKKAIEMALEDAQKQNLKYNYELIFENDKLEAKQAAVITDKFIKADKVRAIISVWGIAAPVVADLANKSQILNLTCAGLSDVSKPFYSFNNYTQDPEIFKTLIKKLQKEKVKTLAFVASQNTVGVSRVVSFPRELKKAGIDVMATELYNPAEKDFRMSIKKIDQLKPDYVVMFMQMPGTKLFVEQYFQITGKRNIAAIDVFHEMPKEYYPIVNGLWYVKSANGTPQFLQEFQKRTQQDVQSCIGNSYENLKLIIWAYENAPLQDNVLIPDNESVAKILYTVKKRKGAIGEYSIDENGVIQSKATLEKMVKGRPAAIK